MRKPKRRIDRVPFVTTQQGWNTIYESLMYRMADRRALPFAKELARVVPTKHPRPNGDIQVFITKQQKGLALRALQAAQ